MADGMFGSIYDVQATDDLMRQKQAQSYGTGWQAMTRAAAGAGGMLGKGISRAFGGMTPLEAKQAKMQEVIAQFPDLDPSDPGQLEEVEAALWNAGLYDQAKMVGEQAVKRYEAKTGRITAMKKSAAGFKQALLDRCNAGDARACRRFDAETSAEESQALAEEKIALYREARTEEIGAKVGSGIYDAKAQEVRERIKGMKTENLFDELTLTNRVARVELENRQIEAQTKKALMDAGYTEAQIAAGIPGAKGDEIRQNIALKMEQAKKLSIENMVAQATAGNTVAQSVLETQRKMAENANIMMRTRSEDARRQYTEEEVAAGIPQANRDKIDQQIENYRASLKETEVNTLVQQANLGNLQAKYELDRREKESLIKRTDAQTQLAIAKAKREGKPGIAENLSQLNKLNKEYIDDIGDWRSRRNEMLTVMSLLKNPNAMTDIGAMTKYLKVLDPESVARESEVAMVESARGIIETLAAMPEKVREGHLLTDTQLENIRGAVQAIYRSQHQAAYEAQENIRQKVATRNKFYGLNLDVSTIIPEHDIVRVDEIPVYDMGEAPATPTAPGGKFTIKKVK